MSKEEIGRQSGQGQVITKDGKFWGYPSDYGPLTSDRAWGDKITDAIIWKKDLDDVTKVFCPSDMSLDGAELKSITKTTVITEEISPKGVVTVMTVSNIIYKEYV